MVFYKRDNQFPDGEKKMLLSGPFLHGRTYGISFSPVDLAAVFHELDDPSKAVLPGIRDRVMIEGVSREARRALGLESEILVTVLPKDTGPVRVRLEHGEEVPLGLLVHEGARAYTLRKLDEEPVGALR